MHVVYLIGAGLTVLFDILGDSILSQIFGAGTIMLIILGLVPAWQTRHDEYDGDLVITQEDDKTTFNLEVETDMDEIPNKESIHFRVVKS